MTLYYKTCQSPLGVLGLLASDKGLAYIFWNTTKKHRSMTPCVKVRDGSRVALLKTTCQELREYFQGTRRQFSIPLDLQGTPFQQKAWMALRQIPYGRTVSYSQQAEMAGSSKGARAIGNANGKNPIPIIIPCHRVIPKSLHFSENLKAHLKDTSFTSWMGGFTGGISKKAFLLRLESKGF